MDRLYVYPLAAYRNGSLTRRHTRGNALKYRLRVTASIGQRLTKTYPSKDCCELRNQKIERRPPHLQPHEVALKGVDREKWSLVVFAFTVLEV